MAAHSTLTGADLHEPKGIGGAANGSVYVANGSGSGAWSTTPTFSNYTTTAALKNANRLALTMRFEDIGTAGNQFIVSPLAGKVAGIWVTCDVAPTGSNTVLTASISGTAITAGNITVPFSGAAAGDVSSCTPSALNVVTAGQAIKINTDGGATNTVPATLVFLLDVS